MAGCVAAAGGWGGSALDPRAANAVEPHNDTGEVDAEAFATFVSVLSSGNPNGFKTIPRDRPDEIALNDPQATYAFEIPKRATAPYFLAAPLKSRRNEDDGFYG